MTQASTESATSHDWYRHYPAGQPHTIPESQLTDLPSILGAACDRFSQQKALTCMGKTLTFGEFRRLAEVFASYLHNYAGVKKGDRVAIMLPNIHQFPVVFYAVQMIGAVAVNTNPLYTAREMRHQFQDSGAKAIVIIDLFMDKLEEIIKDTDIRTVVVTNVGDLLAPLKGAIVKMVMSIKGMIPRHGVNSLSFKEALALGAAKPFTKPHISPDDLCVLQYTGGTTGVSKGAELTHRNLAANMAQIQGVTTGFIDEGKETVLTALPLYHIFALVVNFLAFVRMGQHMILVPKPVPIENTVKEIKKYRPTLMTGVNTLFNALNNNAEFQQHAPKYIKFALAGGMALQEAVSSRWKEITGKRVLEGYGLTEASPVTHVGPLHMQSPVNSMGLPVASTDAKVVDEQGQEVAIGEVGELIVRGPQVMRGYWKRPEETQKTIRNGWLYTGDMAKRDPEGYFYIVDRKKDMILVSGFNVYPNEVEEVLATHPKVLECAVIGVPDSNSGEAVKAFIVPRDQSLSEAEVKAFCEKQLTGYKRPKVIEFRKDLPKSNVGKILRKELRTPGAVTPHS